MRAADSSGAVVVGVAGWTVPGPIADQFEPGGSHLQRYASRFNAVEINSSFYRPHRRATYARWAASVPPGFRFAVKLPKTITHEHRLQDCHPLLERFADEVAGLGETRGPILVQLPPSLAFDPATAQPFLAEARLMLGGPLVCEPRHASWFSNEADTLLANHQISRVAADPPPTQAAAHPGGWRPLAYFRLHGSPRVYWSDYPTATLTQHATRIRALAAAGHEVWTIFDNTAAGQAPVNALELMRMFE